MMRNRILNNMEENILKQSMIEKILIIPKITKEDIQKYKGRY